MKFATALVLATAVHVVVGILLWRTWPAAPPAGEVVPLELRAVEPPAEPPPPPPPVAAEPAAGGKKSPGKKSAAARVETVLTVGDGPAASPAAAAVVGSGPGAVAGTGTGTISGTGLGSATGTGSGSVVDHRALFALTLERIRARRHYPELARRRRLQGTVTVAFRVAPDGAVTGARIKRGADEMLDGAALEAVRGAGPLDAALARDGELEVDLEFTLTP